MRSKKIIGYLVIVIWLCFGIIGLMIYNNRLIKQNNEKNISYDIQNNLDALRNELKEFAEASDRVYERYIVAYEEYPAYIIANAVSPYTVYTVENPEKHKKKIYTEYTEVTDKTSKQYKLLNMDEDGDGAKDIHTDVESGVRVITDQYGVTRFCVAVGTYWSGGKIGRFIDFVMENGSIIPCIVCDVKQTRHTKQYQNKYGSIANDLIEFYIDPRKPFVDYDENGNGLRYKAGDVSSARQDFEGAVKKIIVWDDYLTGFEN